MEKLRMEIDKNSNVLLYWSNTNEATEIFSNISFGTYNAVRYYDFILAMTIDIVIDKY